MTKNNIKSNKKKKVVLVILDGYGIGLENDGNAIYLANPKFINKITSDYPNLKIEASEEFVGLPKNQPGNSEVGHITIGAGRKIYTGLGLINESINNGDFFKNTELNKAIELAKKNNSNIQIFGLASRGDVHASLDHLFATIELCNKNNVAPVVNLISDGRDTIKKQFINDFSEIDKKYLSQNKAKLGVISGRYYAMDRNQNWDRTELYFNELSKVSNDNSPLDYINDCYNQDCTDEFIKPKSFHNAQTKLTDQDVLIFINFRSDRIRQIVHYFTRNNEDYNFVPKVDCSNYVLGFTDYKMKGLKNIAFIQPENKIYLGKIIANNHYKQLRIAETEKYAHVTYFLDNLHKDKLDGLDCILIPSPSVKTYDLKPEMSASKITDYVIENYSKYDFVAINYANSDMVGHTGNLKAAISAIKSLDNEIKRLCKEILPKDEFVIIITADHGNSDEMIDKNGKIVTSHTLNKVPFIILDNSYKLLDSGSLANIAPTILDLMGVDIPDVMDNSLIKKA